MNSFLVLETSSSISSWALFEEHTCVQNATFTERASSGLASSLVPIKEKLTTISKIIMSVGPGSFSGIRVGIASAQGLAAVLKCPIIPIRSTHAIAWSHQAEPQLGIFADARRQQFFHTVYTRGQLSTQTHLVTQEEVSGYLLQHSLNICVDGSINNVLHEVPTAENLGHAYLNFPIESNLALDPIYLHAPVK